MSDPDGRSPLLRPQVSVAEPSAGQETISSRLRYLASHLGPRPVGSLELTRARRYIVETLKSLGLAPDQQAVTLVVPWVRTATVRLADGRSVPCLPVIGAPSTRRTIRGLPKLLGSDVRTGQPLADGSTMALVPFRPGEEGAAIAAAAQRGAQAGLLYLKQLPELYSAVVAEGPVPSVTIRRADALYLAENRQEIELSVVGERTETVVENIMVEVGAGAPTVLLLANYDTRLGTPGAYRNASGVVALLDLLERLRCRRGHRVLVGFLGAEASGATLGASHCRNVLEATHLLEEIRAVVGVSGLGSPRVLVAPGADQPSRWVAGQAVDHLRHQGLVVSMAAPTPPNVWRCPTISVSGLPLMAECTPLDSPDLLDPRRIVTVVTAMEQLLHFLWT